MSKQMLPPRRLPTRLSHSTSPASPERPLASARPRWDLGHSFSRVSVAAPQAKLTVNAPGDQYEQEADAVADQVMRMTTPAPVAQRECHCGGDEEEVQRKEDGDGLEGADVSGAVAEGLSGGGRALDAGTRAFMEARFGQDFSGVRVHTDSLASQSTQAVQARAYTVGADIAFRSGEYDPASEGGKRLLAHELTHVVQQGASVQRMSELQRAFWRPVGNGHIQRDDDPTSTQPASSSVDIGQEYDTAVQTGDWQAAAEYLNGFSAGDIQKRLRGLNQDQINRLNQGAQDNPRVGPQSQVARILAPLANATPAPTPQEDSADGKSHATVDDLSFVVPGIGAGSYSDPYTDDPSSVPAGLVPAGLAAVDVAALRDAYAEGVSAIKAEAELMLSRGVDVAEVADWAAAARNSLKAEIRDQGPQIIKVIAEARNMQEYGNPLGKTAEEFRAQGRTNEQIIESAGRGNLGITKWAGRLRIAGRIMIAIDIGIAFYRIATAPEVDRPKVLTEEVGGISGALAGGWAGARAGAAVGAEIGGVIGGVGTAPVGGEGAVPGAGVGGAIGGVIGGIGGAIAGAWGGHKLGGFIADQFYPVADTRFEGDYQ